MANKNPEVMQRLAAHEICVGTGCLVCSNGVWRRAVISNHSRTAGFDVKLIDTGAYDEILSDSVLALPGELSVMQNQAIECSLVDNVSSETDVLKERIEGKEVIIHVNEVDNNRLIVKVFDLFGDKINIYEDSDEKISPICPMPILSSTHKVSVSYADHSASIWLQRNAEYNLDRSLAAVLDEYYSTSGTKVEPKVGLLCAAKSTDGHWYRAKVIKCTETGVYVNFIDYGNNEEVTPDLLMTLDSRFYIPHQLAINVSLPVILNGTISEQLNILQNYLSNKELTAVFRNVDKKWVAELLYDREKISDKFRSLNSTSEEMSGTGRPQIHNMTLGLTYDVFVSHVDSPSQFWLQRVDDTSDLSKKQEELQMQAPTFPSVDEILEEGSLCVAVYTIDNLWYRAQVLDADEDITTVRFIDYGNTDVIVNKSGNIRQISDSWKEIKEYAMKCRLDVIPTDSEDWNVTTCEKFENLVNSVDSLQALIVANSVPKRVDLLINGKSVSETLVEDHHAIKVHTEEELIDEIVDLELDPHSAFVSHANSPNEFWVQEEKSVGNLEIMTDRFIVADMFPKVDEITENLLCVAKYPEDECWYRARVISHYNNATQVIYIDYGNSATSTEIRAIPADLAGIPPLSRKCSLVMPEGVTEWSEKACEEFIKLAADGATIFLLDVLKEDETSLVKLMLNGKNVTDLLANFCEHYPPITEERLPPLGEENSPNAFVTRVNSIDDFWIQTESSTADLNMMTDRLQAASSFLSLTTFESDTICAAKYSEDEQWYRAKILSHSENGTEVLYIDYGNTDVTNELRMLPVDFINIPPLSKHCALHKPDGVGDWPPEVCKIFEELTATGETMFQFEIIDDSNDPIYVKLTLNGTNVTDILIPCSPNVSPDAPLTKVNSFKSEDLNEKEKEQYVQSQIQEASNYMENVKDNKEEIIQNIDNEHSNINSSLELSVDDIVQNMKMNELDKEVVERNNDSVKSCESSSTEIAAKDFQHVDKVKTLLCNDQNVMEEIKTDIEVTKNNYDTQTTNEKDISSNVIESSNNISIDILTKETINTNDPINEKSKSDGNTNSENLREEQNDTFNLEIESTNKKEVYKLNIETTQCSENLNEQKKEELDSTSKLSATNDTLINVLHKEIICEELENNGKDNLENLQSQNDTFNLEIESTDNKLNIDTTLYSENINEQKIEEFGSTSKLSVTKDTLTNVPQKETIHEELDNNGKDDLENLQGQNNTLNLEIESTDRKEIYELKIDTTQCSENLNDRKKEELNSTSKLFVTNDTLTNVLHKETICEELENSGKDDLKNFQGENNTFNLEIASTNIKDIHESNTDIQCCSKLNERNKEELDSTSTQCITSDTLTNVSHKGSADMNKVTKEKENNGIENCEIQGGEKVDITATNPKDYLELKTDKADKNEYLNPQSVEVASNEHTDITHKQDTSSSSDLVVSMNVNEKNDTENTSDACK